MWFQVVDWLMEYFIFQEDFYIRFNKIDSQFNKYNKFFFD